MAEDPRVSAARYRSARDHDDTDAATPPSQAAQAYSAADRAAVVETAIQQAMRRGDFDNLPGAGKPLPGIGNGRHDPDWWMRRKIEREQLRGIGPVAYLLRTEDADLTERLDALGRPDEVRATVEDFNARILDARRQLLGGPPVITQPRDVDVEVAAWQERRTARAAQRTPLPESEPKRRRRRFRDASPFGRRSSTT